MRRLRIGSGEHKARFCRAFVETHHAYAPDEIRWPALDADALARLRGLPFWGEAVGSERTAAARVRAMADVEPDREMRDAIAMQAYEEERHAFLLDHLLAHYDIPHPDEKAEVPRDAEWGFIRMGYGECFDSFFAFGLFRIAADTGFFGPELVDIFDGVMQEEARHILFFSNWAAYRGVQLPLVQKPWFLVRRSCGVALQALGRVRTALQLRDAETGGDDFTMQVPDEIGDVTLTSLARTCIQ
ncbi:MAG TPA: ferritin-like domain-containing protein, partial [Candidatus Binatia bacterium]|nr:ferritin-like domain-containing protein [Candidatus Binatia bacterium]